MRRIAILAGALAGVLALSGAQGGCEGTGKAPTATASKHADPQHPPQPGDQPAQPVPHADPALIDAAKDDPNLALLELSFHASAPGKIRTFTVRWYGKSPNDTTKVTVQGSQDVENHWDLVLVVQNGQRIGFTAQPAADSFDGYAQCGVWHKGLKGLTSNGAGKRGGCGVSYTILD